MRNFSKVRKKPRTRSLSFAPVVELAQLAVAIEIHLPTGMTKAEPRGREARHDVIVVDPANVLDAAVVDVALVPTRGEP